MIALAAMFIVDTTDDILAPYNKGSRVYVSLSFTHLFLTTMIYAISPKINEGLLEQDGSTSHIGNNISTKDERFFLVHEENGSKKDVSFDELKAMV